MISFQERFNFAFQRESNRRKASGEPTLRKKEIWGAAGASSGAFSQWADGTVCKMSLDKCFQVAPVLRCNPFWLFNGSRKIDDAVEVALAEECVFVLLEKLYAMANDAPSSAKNVGNMVAIYQICA